MDDSIGGFEQKYTQAQTTTLEEMERKSKDRIRVYNPTDEDYTVIWGGYGFVVPSKNRDLGHGKGQQILERYMATNYCTQMIDKILGQKLYQKIREENAARVKDRHQSAMNHWEERPVFEAQYRTNNPDARKELLRILWLGIEEEYGLDLPKQQAGNRVMSIDEELLAQLEAPARKLSDEDLPSLSSTTPQASPEVIDEAKKDELLSEVTGV